MKNITLFEVPQVRRSFSMYAKILSKLRYIFLEVDSILLPLVSAFVFLAWAFILALPFSTFETSQTYNAMAQIMPEWLWSIVLFAIGMLQFGVTFRGSSWQKQAWVNFFAMFIWLIISLTIFLANPLTTGTGVYPMLAALSFGRFYRSLQDKENL